MKTDSDLLKALWALHERGEKLTDETVLYNPKRAAWISGVPYLLTIFRERAFAMNRPDAERLLREFPAVLKGFEVKPAHAKDH